MKFFSNIAVPITFLVLVIAITAIVFDFSGVLELRVGSNGAEFILKSHDWDRAIAPTPPPEPSKFPEQALSHHQAAVQ